MTDDMTDDILANSFERLLQEHCTPAEVRNIESGGDPAPLWAELEQSGFLDALVPEENGGSGLALTDIFGLVFLCGRHAVPVAVGETMVARAALAGAGRNIPQGDISLDDAIEADAPVDSRTIGAVILSARIAGAMDRVFEMTVSHANERTQFGRPIGKFQALQQQISVMAEQKYAAIMAAETGFQSDSWQPDPMLAAVAKSRTSEASIQVCAAAHAIHGAIGATAELDLQLFTRRIHIWRSACGGETYWNRIIGEALIASDNEKILDDIRQTLSA